jgi:hypothetical protein
VDLPDPALFLPPLLLLDPLLAMSPASLAGSGAATPEGICRVRAERTQGLRIRNRQSVSIGDRLTAVRAPDRSAERHVLVTPPCHSSRHVAVTVWRGPCCQ